MAFFDQWDRKDDTTEGENTPNSNNGSNENQENNERHGESGSVSYTPEHRYAPQGDFRPPYMPNYEEKPPKKRAGTVVLCAFLAVALLLGTFFGGTLIGKWYLADNPPIQGGGNGGGSGVGGGGGNKPTGGVNRGDVTLNVVEGVAGIEGVESVPAVVEAVQNAVVEIRTETVVNDPFYGNYVEGGAGSGVIIHSDGLILTCHHVIDGAETITVTLANGEEYVAKVLGTDSWTDLALIDIEGTDFSYANLAKAPEGEGAYAYMQVGETAIAIGNPLGHLGGSVSCGIISALGRKVTVEGVPMTLLQIDASVNPGNSGGGLFNMKGQLIGIVNAKSTGESIEGIGFAIPSSDAIDIVKQLYKQGYVSGRPYLGMYFQATSYGLQIVNYEYNDELAAGGNTIKSGDYLRYMDGQEITEMNDIRTILAQKAVGDTVTIQIYRMNGRYSGMTLEFTLTVHEHIPDITE